MGVYQYWLDKKQSRTVYIINVYVHLVITDRHAVIYEVFIAVLIIKNY
jgi:hypothetical protein